MVTSGWQANKVFDAVDTKDKADTEDIFYPLFRSISLNIKIITTKPQLRGFMVKLIWLLQVGRRIRCLTL
jgi:hypothetical protein